MEKKMVDKYSYELLVQGAKMILQTHEITCKGEDCALSGIDLLKFGLKGLGEKC